MRQISDYRKFVKGDTTYNAKGDTTYVGRKKAVECNPHEGIDGQNFEALQTHGLAIDHLEERGVEEVTVGAVAIIGSCGTKKKQSSVKFVSSSQD